MADQLDSMAVPKRFFIWLWQVIKYGSNKWKRFNLTPNHTNFKIIEWFFWPGGNFVEKNPKWTLVWAHHGLPAHATRFSDDLKRTMKITSHRPLLSNLTCKLRNAIDEAWKTVVLGLTKHEKHVLCNTYAYMPKFSSSFSHCRIYSLFKPLRVIFRIKFSVLPM
jgi:hypothetical protein